MINSPRLFFHPKLIAKVDPWCSDNGSNISLRAESIQILVLACCLEGENMVALQFTLPG